VAVIHIAAHGSAEGGQIALAPPTPAETGRISEEQDYMLTMQEVQESGVRAQLVVTRSKLKCVFPFCENFDQMKGSPRKNTIFALKTKPLHGIKIVFCELL
jgi:hypothetical protein